MTNSKPHRFDHFALKMAANMITAIRTTLSVFTSPDKERWPATRLLDYLKGAEDLAREMLREIAAKIFISPAKIRERSELGPLTPCDVTREYSPCFRLGVKTEKDDSPEEDGTLGRSPEHSEPEGHTSKAQAQRPSEAGIAAGKTHKPDDRQESLFASRLSALEDVLAHPGKHAARMARALHRAEHGSGQRLMAKNENDLVMDFANRICDDPAYFVSKNAEADFAKIAHLFDNSS